MKRFAGTVLLFSTLISFADEWKPEPAMIGSFSSSPGERKRAFLENPLPGKGGDSRYTILFVADLRRELLVRVSETDTVEHAFASMRDPATLRADGRFCRLSESLPEEWSEKLSRLPDQAEIDKERP